MSFSTINGAQSSTLSGANHECAARCLDHILCDDMQFVDPQDTLNLHEQPVEQSEVSAGDAADGGHGLRVRKIRTVEGQAECTPVARQHKGEFIALQRTVV